MNRTAKHYLKLKKHLPAFFCAAALSLVPLATANAAGFFSGYAGARTDINFAKDGGASFGMGLKLNSFFAGQFTITESLIARAEFSLAAHDLMNFGIFKSGVDATFQIDEISLIYRKDFFGGTNYLSGFIGTYEPIGSDIFLRRQFGAQAMASKLTQSWLGLAGSVIYPLFGIGASDVIHFASQPIAAGIYVYVNDEIRSGDDFDFNTDLRLACAYRYFYFDMAFGINMPVLQNDDAYFYVNEISGHGGMNMLIGSNYTRTSFFMQAGIYNFTARKGQPFSFPYDSVYLLAEFRARLSPHLFTFAVFNFPQDTASNFIFVRDTLGVNVSWGNGALHLASLPLEVGIHGTLSFAQKKLDDFAEILSFFDNDTPNLRISPYLSLAIGQGELNAMFQLNVWDFVRGAPAKAFAVNVAYRARF